MLAVLFIGALSLLVYAVIRYYKFTSRYPEGPFPLPFIGNVIGFEFQAQYKSLAKFGKQQPPIYTVFTPIPIVQITDFALIKEAYVEKGDDFANRPTIKVIEEAFSFAPNAGVLNSSGENWREQRRASIMILRDFGMGKNLMESRVGSSISDYIDHLRNIHDKDNADVFWPIQVMVANIINETLFGYRYTHEDCAPLMEYVEDTRKFFENLADSKALFLGMMFPILNRLPITSWYTFGRFKAAMEKINSYIVKNVERAQKDYNVEDEPACFVHAYKQKMAQNVFLDQTNLFACCSDFFIAGTETTATTLKWAMLIFAKNPEAQEKLREELNTVIGKERPITMADQSSLPFARACVLELQRFANILGSNVQHYTTRDTEIQGHKIPKDTWVNADIHYLMNNDPFFVDPKVFRPERYLMQDGRTLRKDLVERTIPFSIGKRACAGEGLARVELFLGLSATFQHFKISPSPGKEIDLIALPGTILFPRPQTLRIEQV